jgi:hypothetical protein
MYRETTFLIPFSGGSIWSSIELLTENASLAHALARALDFCTSTFLEQLRAAFVVVALCARQCECQSSVGVFTNAKLEATIGRIQEQR